MRWTKRDASNHFYVISKRGVVLYEIIERISDIETEMNVPENKRWTKGKSLKYRSYNHVYELIQRLGELEDDVLRFRQRKKIHDKIQAIQNECLSARKGD